MSVEIGTLVVVGTMVAGLLAAAMGTLFGMPFGLGFLGGSLLLPMGLCTLWLLSSMMERLLNSVGQLLFGNRGRRRRR